MKWLNIEELERCIETQEYIKHHPNYRHPPFSEKVTVTQITKDYRMRDGVYGVYFSNGKRTRLTRDGRGAISMNPMFILAGNKNQLRYCRCDSDRTAYLGNILTCLACKKAKPRS